MRAVIFWKTRHQKVYKSLILEKIFGGMKQRFLNHVSDADADNIDNLQEWMDDDMYTCINRKKDDVKAVMKALRRNADGPLQGDFDAMEGQFYGLMLESWIYPVFNTYAPETGPLNKMKESFQDCWGQIAEKKDSPTHMLINSLMKDVFSDEESDTRLFAW